MLGINIMKRDPAFKITHWPINLLIQKIDSGDTALPELQRPFVWDNAKNTGKTY